MLIRGLEFSNFEATEVALDDGGYDEFGSYFGLGETLYCVTFDRKSDEEWRDFVCESENVRAESGELAIRAVQASLAANFYL